METNPYEKKVKVVGIIYKLAGKTEPGPSYPAHLAATLFKWIDD